MIKKVTFIIILFLLVSTKVKGEVISINDFEFEESLQVLKDADYDYLKFDTIINYISEGKIVELFSYLIQGIYSGTIGDVAIVEKVIIILVVIVLISAFFTNFASVFNRDSISDTGFYISYLIVITFIVSLFEMFIGIAISFITVLLQFVGAIIPAYMMSIALFNQVTAAGYYQVIIIIISVVQIIFLNIVVPLIKIYLAISLVNNISREDLLSKTADLIKKAIDFLNKALFGLVTGINMVQCLILPSIDSTKNNSIKKILGAIPVIGDSTEAYTTVLTGSANLIKNSIGIFAICAIIFICAIPYIKILLYSISMHLASAIVQPIADKRIIESLNCLNTSLNLIMKVIVTNGTLFVVSIAIVSVFTGK